MSAHSSQYSILENLRHDFTREVNAFWTRHGVDNDYKFSFDPDNPAASKVYIVTGVSFKPYDENTHGTNDTHAFASVQNKDGQRYLMNNAAAIAERLLQRGDRVIIHAKDRELTSFVASLYAESRAVEAEACIIDGDLGSQAFTRDLYEQLESMSKKKPISDVRMALYQSFAQNNGVPFKPMHLEGVEEVEGAACKRIRFVYNMAAVSYDMLMNRNLEQLRVVSLSALASRRPSYGLLADAADKFMNDLLWRTFYLEANISTGKPVAIYQLNTGITTACDIYNDQDTRQLILRESLADGFPFDDDVLQGREDIPQMSSIDVARVADILLRAEDGSNPNDQLDDGLRSYLYAGHRPDDLVNKIKRAVHIDGDVISVDPSCDLPEHILGQGSHYGALPTCIEPKTYKRVSLCPEGQRF